MRARWSREIGLFGGTALGSAEQGHRPPRRYGTRALPRQGNRPLRRYGARVSTRQGNRPLRRYGARVSTGMGNRPLRGYGARFHGAERSASSEVRRSASRSGHLLGAEPDIVVTVTDALRSGGGEPRRGCSLRRSSERRLADLERGRQTAFFGAPRVGLTGTGSIVLFGTRSHPSHREQDSWTLRTIGTHPIGNGKSIATSLGAR